MSKLIKLTKNKECIVDDSYYEELSKYKWYYSGRTACRRDCKTRKVIVMSRQILDAVSLPSNIYVDHINGNDLDNRKDNLRFATNQQNQANSKIPKNNTSGYKGVTWSKEKNKWYAHIMVNHKGLHLGYFNNIIDAAIAYNIAALNYFGNFSRLNNIEV